LPFFPVFIKKKGKKGKKRKGGRGERREGRKGGGDLCENAVLFENRQGIVRTCFDP